MADIRINSLPSTATSFNTDDYIAIDGASAGTRKMLAANPPFSDVTLGTSGPSVKSTLSARAPRQGLVFDGTAGATATISALGTAPFTVSAVFSAKSLAANNAIIDFNTGVGSSILIYVTTTGRIVIYDRVANATLYQSNTGVIEVNKIYHIAYARGVGVFVNGVNISGSFADGSNYTDTVYRIGWAASNDSFCTGFLSIFIYNRALSASEVVALYEAGAPSGADYATPAATNTNQITGDAWWDTKTGSVSSGTITLTSGQYAVRSAVLTKGKRYRTTYNVTALTGIVQVGNTSAAPSVVQILSLGAGSFEFTANDNNAFGFNASSGTATINNVTFIPVGLLLAPDAAQAGGGLTWYDTSGNAANITLPASGVSWNVPSSRVLGGNWTTSGNHFVGTTTDTGGRLVVDKASQVAASSTASGGIVVSNLAAGNAVLELGANATYLGYIQTRNYTTGGFYQLNLNPVAGNVLIGTTTDLGQKLQVNGNSGFLGHLEIPADKHIYMKQGNPLRWSSDGLSTGTVRADIYADSGGILYFRTNGTAAALNIDASQNATFAGQVTSKGTVLSVNTGLYTSDATLSSYATNNGVYLNGHAGGFLLLSGSGAGGSRVKLNGGTGAGATIIFSSNNNTTALTVDGGQNIIPGTAALATTATDGFIYLQTCAGAPTGVPTSYTGRVASIYDTTNNKLYIYNGGWKSVTLA